CRMHARSHGPGARRHRVRRRVHVPSGTRTRTGRRCPHGVRHCPYRPPEQRQGCISVRGDATSQLHMMSPPTTEHTMIREATAEDVENAADTLTSAFVDYPFTRHTIDADGHEVRLREFQRLFLAEVGLPHGRVWVSDDLDAVAVWSTPDGEAGPTLERLLPRMVEIAGDRARAHASAEAAMEPHRPQ